MTCWRLSLIDGIMILDSENLSQPEIDIGQEQPNVNGSLSLVKATWSWNDGKHCS